MQMFDLSIPAENGMRRGRTSGSCAAAAAKAAVLFSRGQVVDEVEITLPGGTFALPVPVEHVGFAEDGSIRAEVRKFAGDDPDATDGATIYCLCRQNKLRQIRLFAADGVGVVTQPGIRIPVGEAAINPVPREMIKRSVFEALDLDFSVSEEPGFDIAIGCVGGREIAAKTFNPRLGILGGISILGTTGIVEPMSLAAYQASVEVYIRVALGDKPESIALLPGNIGSGFARKQGLTRKRTVNISNFLGFSLEAVQRTLVELNYRLETLLVLGHPGKLAKALGGHWDTHSRNSPMAMPYIASMAEELSLTCAEEIREANTVEAVVELLNSYSNSRILWHEMEKRLEHLFAVKVPFTDKVQVRLFDMSGNTLSDGYEK